VQRTDTHLGFNIHRAIVVFLEKGILSNIKISPFGVDFELSNLADLYYAQTAT